jgi:3-hydroxy acid dehydrogenase/malonic semialdehyde reductase
VVIPMSVELETYPRLAGKVVLITGASAGIGEATALVFAASGAHLVLGARRKERLDQLREQLSQKYGVKVHTGSLDVCSKDSVEAFVTSIPADMQEIDVLVNNAGLALGRDDAHVVSEEDVDAMIDTNVKGLVRVTRAVVPGMMGRNRGHIINISSVAGVEAYKGGSIYCATKHAVQAITKSQRKELVHTPLRVTSICPGLVDTEFSLVRFKGDSGKASEPYKGLDPLVARDVADTVAYAASRPPHVQVADLLLFPTNQASSELIHRAL